MAFSLPSSEGVSEENCPDEQTEEVEEEGECEGECKDEDDEKSDEYGSPEFVEAGSAAADSSS
jgi:hypothetical protein